MRGLFALLLLVTLGIVLGIGTSAGALWRLAQPAEALVAPRIPEEIARTNPLVNPDAPHPRAIARQTEFDFGQMERGAKLSHPFAIRNEGTAPLKLTKGRTSCTCTLSGLDKEEIRPGEEATVTLEWIADTDQPTFRQSATIHTNDPGRPELEFEITGKVVQQIRLEPSELRISKIAGETKSYRVRVTSVNFEDLQILGSSFEDPRTASCFEVAARPLTAEELMLPDASGLQPVGGSLVTVTAKPGLPLGPIRQRIRLTTNIAEKSELELPIFGTIDGDISVAGGLQWNRDDMVLSLGVLPANTIARHELKLLVRGPEAGKVEFRVAKVTPDVVAVKLGESKSLSDGRVQQVPLVIEIPRGLPTMSFMGKNHGGFGEVVLATTHPEIPELHLKLKFAIEN
jgi:hypothetical protein